MEAQQEASPDGAVTRVRAGEAPRVVEALTALAAGAGTQVTDLVIQPATLEDVFLSVTGRGLTG
jgi:hypothetical protein